MIFTSDMGTLFAIPILPSLAMAMPPAIRERSWKRFLGALLLSLFGIVLPVLIYLGTAALAPDSKEGCDYNWLHGFQMGKIALIPLVLWACAAFYASQVNRREIEHRTWVVLGIFTGAVIGDACLAFTIALVHFRTPFDLLSLVPFYIAVWYSVLAARMLKSSDLGIRYYAMTLLGSLPFWVGSMIWSRQYYLSLPEFQPKCFVVTAALGGHQGLVGPFTQIHRNGATRIANRQLLIFWQFENIWGDRSPRTHKAFRRIYNRVGPFIAERVKTRLAADVVYLAIKPFEWIAAIVCKRYHKSSASSRRG